MPDYLLETGLTGSLHGTVELEVFARSQGHNHDTQFVLDMSPNREIQDLRDRESLAV